MWFMAKIWTKQKDIEQIKVYIYACMSVSIVLSIVGI